MLYALEPPPRVSALVIENLATASVRLAIALIAVDIPSILPVFKLATELKNGSAATANADSCAPTHGKEATVMPARTNAIPPIAAAIPAIFPILAEFHDNELEALARI